MKHENSYGAVVYRIQDDTIFVLVEHMVLGHVSIPKGHIEEGETPIQCAKREIKEETNIDCDIDTGFTRTITYSPKEGVIKDVTFYAGKATSLTIVSQPEEVKYCEWLTPEEAINRVTFQSDKETLKEAAIYLRKKTKAQ